MPLERSLDVIGHVREQADRIAEVFVQLFLDAVWSPFEASGQPRERWTDVQEALERLHPLAAESVVAVFGLAMSDAVEREFGRTVERIAQGARDGRARARARRARARRATGGVEDAVARAWRRRC